MAKKDLDGVADKVKSSVRNLTEEKRNDSKRLTFPVTGEEHTQFKKEAADAGLSMSEYFNRLWKKGR